MRRRLTALGVCLALWAITAGFPPAAAFAHEAWLDQPLSNWNSPGMDLPQAPQMDPSTNPECLSQKRPAETDADQAVEGAGWTLFGSYQAGWDTDIVRGLSGYDGMCRPLGYNEFVFVDGQFAGTISPELMNSRTDGAGEARAMAVKDIISAQFQRYQPDDPLCCPSGSADVVYQIDRSGPAPVLAPQFVTAH